MDVQELTHELARLDEQVKLLVKTERRLHHAQKVIEDQLAQFRSLNALALRIGRAGDAVTILDAALETLLEVLRVDQGVAFLGTTSGSLLLTAVKTQPGLAPPADRCWLEAVEPPPLSKAVFVADARTASLDHDLARFFGAVTRYLAIDDADAAAPAITIAFPLKRKSSGLLGVVVLRKVEQAPSYHEHAVSSADLPFLDLVASHTEAALENVLLYRQVALSASQLERKVVERTSDLAHANQGLARSQEKLAEAFEFRDQVMGILGHDLRNPLSAVRMSAGLVLRREGLTEELRRNVQRIDNAAGRMVEMIGTLLDFTQSRFRANLPISPEPMNLHEVCRAAIEELVPAYPGRVVEVDLRGDGRGKWDPARVAQIVSNLVSNALTHGDKCEPVHVAIAEEEEAIVLEVRNYGAAIAKDRIPGLFEPFRRGPESEKASRWGGLGLGLYIVQSIVRAHGGRIDVDSSPETGTAFTVRLPRESLPVC